MRIIRLPNGLRVNIDFITTYQEVTFYGKKSVNIFLAGRNSEHVINADLTVEEFEKLLDETSVFSKSDQETICKFRKSMDELKNAIGRIPTSIHLN